MSATNVVDPARADVEAILDQVWSAFFGEDEHLTHTQDHPGTNVDWSATVTVTGDWDGAISLELPADAARAVTRQMLGFGENDELDEADVADAVGELVNMIGGNIKSLMPGPSALSIPVVSTGQIAVLSSQTEVLRLTSLWQAHPVTVSIHCG